MNVDGIKKQNNNSGISQLQYPVQREIVSAEGRSRQGLSLAPIIFSVTITPDTPIRVRGKKLQNSLKRAISTAVKIFMTILARLRRAKILQPKQLSRQLLSKSFYSFQWQFRILAKKIVTDHTVVVAAMFVIILLAFMSGMWTTLNTQKSIADKQPAELTVLANGPSVIASFGSVPTSSVPSTLNTDVLYNTPIEYLQNYFTSPPPAPDALAERKEKLKKFLTDMRSPLLSEVNTIAQQPHWKLILAISFAESTLGRHCASFNCSGIGGANIKPYNTLKDWIIDFNKLLEKRYKDNTLKQMCGVYVQPCNPNWLSATGQILEDLKVRGIE